jgi:hypothetical protein
MTEDNTKIKPAVKDIEEKIEEKITVKEIKKDIPKKKVEKLLASEWARSRGKDEMSFLYFDKLSIITEEEFNKL